MPATLTKAFVSPNGKSLAVRCGSKVTNVPGGLSYRVGGGPPVTPDRWLWEHDSNENVSDWVYFPLTTVDVGDFFQAVESPARVGDGWAEMTPANSMLGGGYGVAYRDRFLQTSTPTDSLTHTFGPPIGGYDVFLNIRGLVGPGRTTDAVYTISDGVGVLATVHLDQTQRPPHDTNYALLRLTRIATVTTRTTTLTITVGNGAGSGALVSDAILVKTHQPRIIPEGAAVTVQAKAGAIVTADGPIPATTDLAATHLTPVTWPDPERAFDPAKPRKMRVGVNKAMCESGQASVFYANLFKQSTGWGLRSGSWTQDEHGEILTIDGEAVAHIAGTSSNGDDPCGIKTIPSSGTLTLRCNYGGAGDPLVSYRGEGGNDQVYFGPVVWGPNDPASGKRVCTCDYAMRQFQPMTTVGTPYYPQYTYMLGLRTRSAIRDVEVYTGTPPAAGKLAHPEFLRRHKGRRLGAMRTLDLFHTNNCNRSQYSHFTHPLDVSPEWNAYSKTPPTYAVVTRFDPIDTNPATDLDDVYKWNPWGANYGWCKVTTAGPHNLVAGQSTTYVGTPAGYPSGDGPDLTFNDGNACKVVPLTATTYLQEMRYPAWNHAGGRMLTLASSHDVTGLGSVVRTDNPQSVAWEDCVQVLAEADLPPWFCVPPLVDDFTVDRMADVALAGTPPGRKQYWEYGNETWNTGFRAIWYYNMMAYRQAYLRARDPAKSPEDPVDGYEWWAMRGDQLRARVVGRAALQGRAADIEWVYGSQAGWAGGSTQRAANYLHRHSLPMPNNAIDTYQDMGPSLSNCFNDYPSFASADAAFARMDTDMLVDLYEVLVTLTGRSRMFQLHRNVLAGTNGVTGVPFGGYFSATKQLSYEGGPAYLASQHLDHSYLGQTVQRSHEVARHPRMFFAVLKELAEIEAGGCDLYMRYTDDKTNVISGPAEWYDYPMIDTREGHGWPEENACPYDLESLVSQTAGALRFWASDATAFPRLQPPTPATSIALAGPASGVVGAVSGVFTLTPDGSISDVVTLSDGSDGTFTPTPIALAGTTPKTVRYRPGSVGPKTITVAGTATPVVPTSLAYAAAAPPVLVAVLHDTFTGPAGAPITGSKPTPLAHGSDAWEAHPPAYPPFVFAAGGGATTAVATGGPWFSGIALTGVGTDQDITVAFRFVETAGNVQMNIYARRAPTLNVQVRCLAGTNQLVLGDHTNLSVASTARVWAPGRTYVLKLILRGSSATVTLDGAPMLVGTMAPTGAATEFFLCQQDGSAGAVVFEGVKIETAADSTTPASCTPRSGFPRGILGGILQGVI